jgi:hypothetical protein
MDMPPSWQRPDPLRGLEDVPWTELSDGRGSARGVDDLLRQVTDEDDDVRTAALAELVDRLLTEDTVSEASAWAVPFLVELAASYKVPVDARDRVIFLLAAMALAGRGLTDDGKHTRRRWNTLGRELPRLAPDWLTQTRYAVAKGAPKVFESLTQFGRDDVPCTAALACAVPEVVPTHSARAIWLVDEDGPYSDVYVESATTADHLIKGSSLGPYMLEGIAGGHPDVLRDFKNGRYPPNQPDELTAALMGYRFAFLAAYGEEG